MWIDDRTSSLATNNAFAQLRNLERNVCDDGSVFGQLSIAMDQACDKLVVDSANYVC